MTKLKERIKKRQQKRKKEDCIKEIHKILKLSNCPMTTKKIADKVITERKQKAMLVSIIFLIVVLIIGFILRLINGGI